MSKKRYKILISCYACSPYQGSEPGLGWNFVKGLSEYHEVHVISEEIKWKDDIKEILAANPSLARNLTFYFIPKRRNRTLRKVWPPSYYWYYKEWQKKAYDLALNLQEIENFDLIHQLNMVGFREPGYLWKMDKPFIWGPIGGMEITPWRFLPVMGFYGAMYYLGRNIFNLYQRRYLIRPRKAARRRNNKLIAATPDTQKAIEDNWGVYSEVISEVGIEKTKKVANITKRHSDESLRIIWAGVHTPRKALNLLLETLQDLKLLDIELHVLGDGKYHHKWKKLSIKKNVNDNIKWYGWVSKERVHKIMSQGHLFCITSLHDLTSTVVLEAISQGLPVICLDHCGFAEVIDNTCGIKIPVNTPNQVTTEMADAIRKLYNNESLRLKLSKGALTKAKEYSWDKKIKKVNHIYDELVNERN